jgi:hypothetical protein
LTKNRIIRDAPKPHQHAVNRQEEFQRERTNLGITHRIPARKKKLGKPEGKRGGKPRSAGVSPEPRYSVLLAYFAADTHGHGDSGLASGSNPVAAAA